MALLVVALAQTQTRTLQNTKSEDTLFMRFPRRAKDVDVRG